MHYLIGIDDTDNLESRGTGFRARKLGANLERLGLATLMGITRHQLLVAPEVPYTSHNSSACLLVEAQPEQQELLARACRDFLARESAPGSDTGLCFALREAVRATVQAFGARTKREVVTAAQALDLARQEGLVLEGLTGTGDGVIGALAAVGLRAGGNDGRFIWLGGVRDLSASLQSGAGRGGELSGLYPVDVLRSTTGIEEICALDGTAIPPTACVEVGEWVRPVLRNKRAVLLVERIDDDGDGTWRVLPKAALKEHSN